MKILTLVLLLFAFLSASAQQITGTISGTVTDPTGAVVANAQVKAHNKATGFTRTVKSDKAGLYSLNYLPIGEYEVSITAAGFAAIEQKSITLQVDQTLSLNFALTIGSADTTIVVSDAPPDVQTETVEVARTITQQELLSLPLINRDAYEEISLTPGVMTNSNSAQNNPNGTPNFNIGVPSVQVQVNGGIDGGVPTVSYYLDGGINMTGLRNYGNPLPSPDALQEIRIETSNYSAQYGRMSGAVVSAVTRSGTNNLHGSIFEFNRNTAFNARPWTFTQYQHYRRNNFGATLGGPIKKDKAFFFLSYQGTRQVIGTPLTGAIVSTAANRMGDFTNLTTKLVLPGTKTLMIGTNASPNCSVPTQNCLPSNLLDPTAINLLKYIPLPTGANGTWSGYFDGQTVQNGYLGKYDQVFGQRDHVVASYFQLNSLQDIYGGGNIPWTLTRSQAQQYNANISDIHIFNRSTVNQAWGTFTRVNGGRVILPPIGLDQLGSTFTTQGPQALPGLYVSGFFSAGVGLAGPVSVTDLYSARDLVTITKGRHTLNLGGETSLEKDAFQGTLSNSGSFGFSSPGTNSTGNAEADLVSGVVQNMEQDSPYHALLSQWYYAAFAQDLYHVSRNLTLTLGLRWDVQTPPVESQNLTATFVPNQQSTVVPTAPAGMLFVGDTGMTRGIVPIRYQHVSPRVGFAWDVFGDGKTAFRAGAGLFYGSVSANEWSQPANSQPFAVRQTFYCITSLTNVYGCKSSFPNGDPFPYYYNPSNPRYLANASIEAISNTFQWPYSYQLNATVQQQMPGNFILSVAYVGTLSHDLPIMIDANAPRYTTGTTTARPYGQNGKLGQVLYGESTQTGSYHSLQVTATRRYGKSFSLYGFYVFSKAFQSSNEAAVGLASSVQDFYYLQEERGVLDADRTHTAALSGVFKPTLYTGARHILRTALNGWSVSANAYLDSGYPFSVLTGADMNGDGYGSDRPNLVPNVSPILDPHRSRRVSALAWFNTKAFTPNGPGRGGIGPNGADGNEPRDYLRAPGYKDLDCSLSHDFQFHRNAALQIRADAINVSNTVSLGTPNATLNSPQVGQITSAASQRLVQLGARLSF